MKIDKITIKERGATPGLMKREFNRLSKSSWEDAAKIHHRDNTAKRFTPSHAEKAGYAKRKGQNLPKGSPRFKRSYYGRKYFDPNRGGGAGRADPLHNTGESLRRSRFPTLRASATGARLRYRTPALNFRNPKSRVNMAKEFRTILRSEKADIVRNYDAGLDDRLDSITTQQTEVIQ